ncbi:MAG: GIY-YIG nuclease family protein, partial [Bradymonadaceae bacterium]
MSDEWYLNVLECADGSLYTGITTDVERRVREHNGERTGGANYTRARRPVRVRAAWPCDDQSEAASAEAAFKSLSRDEKLGRIAVGLSPSRFEDVVDEYLAVFDVDGAEPTQFQPVSLAGDDGTDVALATRMREHVEDAREALAERAPGPTRPAT